MSQFYSLFSSSKGNASYIGTPSCGLLVDVGVSNRRLVQALVERGLSPRAITALLITHTHSDHITGLRVFLKQYPLPVYASPETLETLYAENLLPEGIPTYPISCGDVVTIADIKVEAFPTRHDARGSQDYRFTCPDGQVAAICTDLGIVTDAVREGTRGADLVLLEANYDPTMLQNGSYPSALKARISGKDGHLSNEDSAHFARELIGSGTTRLVLGHLSKQNNTPTLAEKTVHRYLSEQGLHRNQDYLLAVSTPNGLERSVIF